MENIPFRMHFWVQSHASMRTWQAPLGLHVAKGMQVFGGALLSYAGEFRGCPRMLMDLWGLA